MLAEERTGGAEFCCAGPAVVARANPQDMIAARVVRTASVANRMARLMPRAGAVSGLLLSSVALCFTRPLFGKRLPHH